MLLSSKINPDKYDRVIAVHEQIPEFALYYLFLIQLFNIKKIKKKLVLYIHSSPDENLKLKSTRRAVILNRIQSFLRKFVFELIIVNSRKIQNELNKKETPSEIIYNPLDFEYMDKAASEVDSLNDNVLDLLSKKYFLVVAKVSPVKNLQYVIESFNLVKDKIGENLIILGYVEDYVLYDKLTEYIKKNNLERRIFFPGQQKNPYHFMKNATALICTSFVESFSMAVHEAMYFRTPVVLTKFPGYKEFFSNDNSILIEYNDELPGVLESLSRMEIETISRVENAFEYVKRYSIKNIVDDFSKLLLK
ncbi:MAG: glycosyltransferase [Ignavibacteriaceae bacterium]